jgi:hypothetical protein
VAAIGQIMRSEPSSASAGEDRIQEELDGDVGTKLYLIPYFLVINIRRISLIIAYSLLSACYFVGLSTRY